MLTEEQKRKLRKNELSDSFSTMKDNGGGTVTFHYVEEIITKKGKIKKESVSKQVINISSQAIEKKSLYDFVSLLKSMQNDLRADYFTF